MDTDQTLITIFKFLVIAGNHAGVKLAFQLPYPGSASQSVTVITARQTQI